MRYLKKSTTANIGKGQVKVKKPALIVQLYAK
jgi:hypothetical protein